MDLLIALGVVGGGATLIYFWLNGEEQYKTQLHVLPKDQRAYVDALVIKYPELAKVGDPATIRKFNQITKQDCDQGIAAACKLWNSNNPTPK